jgi:hypothetical protein
MTTYHVIINVRDRLASLVPLVDWLERAGNAEIWLLDNGSTYEPLLDYLSASPHHVRRTHANLWHTAPWLSGLVPELNRFASVVVTDPDVVPDEECPLDALDHFADVLNRYPDVLKVGFGLRIDDLPAHYAHADTVVAWEQKYWQREIAPGLFDAPIDTTFAMYRAGVGYVLAPALRTGAPYLARHLGWYEDSAHPGDELLHYRAHADPLTTNWEGERAPAWKLKALRDRMRADEV